MNVLESSFLLPNSSVYIYNFKESNDYTASSVKLFSDKEKTIPTKSIVAEFFVCKRHPKLMTQEEVWRFLNMYGFYKDSWTYKWKTNNTVTLFQGDNPVTNLHFDIATGKAKKYLEEIGVTPAKF